MMDHKMIREMLYTNPLSFLVVKDQETIDYVNNLVPYSTAFEIECDYGENYDVRSFETIPDIMSVDNDCGEQRYRVPNGLMGIICVYNISKQLKINSLLNPASGIHYHVDCTDCFDDIVKMIGRNKENVEWILSELDTWLEGDEAHGRSMGSWFKLNDLKTVEFRLGEMTFEYGRLLKRIIHCNSMVKKFKDQISAAIQPVFKELDKEKLLAYQAATINITNNKLDLQAYRLEEKLREIDNKDKKPDIDELKSQFRKRLHKLYDDDGEQD